MFSRLAPNAVCRELQRESGSLRRAWPSDGSLRGLVVPLATCTQSSRSAGTVIMSYQQPYNQPPAMEPGGTIACAAAPLITGGSGAHCTCRCLHRLLVGVAGPGLRRDGGDQPGHPGTKSALLPAGAPAGPAAAGPAPGYGSPTAAYGAAPALAAGTAPGAYGAAPHAEQPAGGAPAPARPLQPGGEGAWLPWQMGPLNAARLCGSAGCCGKTWRCLQYLGCASCTSGLAR